MEENSRSREELQAEFQPLQEELNLKLVTADLRHFDIAKLSEILNLLDRMQVVVSGYDLPVFINSFNLLTQFLGQVVTENISYPTGMSYALNLYEMFEDAVEEYIGGQDVLPEFEEKISRFKKIFEEVDLDGIIKSTADDEAVIQVLPEEVLEEGLLADFVGESEEGLELAEAKLLELEKDPADHEPINLIFRTIHTLKGTSGFLGLVVIGVTAHQMEDLLVLIRAGERELTPAIFDAFFKAMDTFKQLLAQVKDILQGKPPDPVNIRETNELLVACLMDSQKRESESADSAEPRLLGDILVDDGQITMDQVEEALSTQQKPIGQILVEKGVVSEETVEEALGKQEKLKATAKVVDMVKVPADKLDELAELTGELVVALSVLSQNPIISNITDREAHERLDQLDKVTETLRDRILGIRMFPVGNVFSKLSRQVRDLSRKSGKTINLSIEGADTLVDKTVIDGIYAPLMHLVRNAIDHGIEDAEARRAAEKSIEGNVLLRARHAGDSILVEIKDDGKGLQRDAILTKAVEKGFAKAGENLTDQQIFSFIFQAGFSTAKKVTDVSGRGVGMDVVKRDVENLRGKVSTESTPGIGTTFTIKLPLTTSIIEGLVVRIGQNRFIVPILDVVLTVTPKNEELKGAQGREKEFFILAGELVPIVRLYTFFDIEPEVTDPSEALIIVVANGAGQFGLMVDELLHRQQIVIKNLGDRFDDLCGITGGTILGDGRIGLILEPEELIGRHRSQVASGE
ncbi:MAG: chemotaxis protein CheA [Proteobacteria bacterium]|nr:chemotaxis protein CheA [Pseudomonadota bacterium]